MLTALNGVTSYTPPLAWMRRRFTYGEIKGREEQGPLPLEAAVTVDKMYEDDIPLFAHFDTGFNTENIGDDELAEKLANAIYNVVHDPARQFDGAVFMSAAWAVIERLNKLKVPLNRRAQKEKPTC